LQQEESQNSISNDTILNFFTSIIAILIIAIIYFQVTIFLNPYVSFNPFPPYQLPEALVLETPQLVATSTLEISIPTATNTIQPTEKIIATEIILPTATGNETFVEGTPVLETQSVPPTEIPFNGIYAFELQNDINAIESTIFKPNYGCDWSGVAGQVFDLQGRPVMGVRVWLRGTYNYQHIDILSLTLESSPYGPSGFEFTLGDKPVDSYGNLSIQLLDQANIPISDEIYFNTYADCSKNLIIMNFKQVR